jgi:hypothetical protein
MFYMKTFDFLNFKSAQLLSGWLSPHNLHLSVRRAQAGNSFRLPVRERTQTGHHAGLSVLKADRTLQ